MIKDMKDEVDRVLESLSEGDEKKNQLTAAINNCKGHRFDDFIPAAWISGICLADDLPNIPGITVSN